MFQTNLPKDFKNIIDINILLLTAYAIIYMTSVNGIVTIDFIDKNFVNIEDVNITYNNLSLDYNVYDVNYNLNSYNKSLKSKVIRNQYLLFFLYFIMIPFINIIYGLWCFKNGFISSKDLYSFMNIINRGEKKNEKYFIGKKEKKRFC